MRQFKPSYGVFMVDIFASSVGIFILVSLLYIIETSNATSDEAMVERFKTLIKRDLIPVDRYSMPVNHDPLHDWGVRARHAREQQEALILLLKDQVLLYHSNQLLNTQQIVDSDIIANYYQTYQKQHRLFIEIHYHDAYHTLKAKIDEALPPNVSQWVHWAYNAGNIDNPNPVAAHAPRPKLSMNTDNNQERDSTPDPLAMGSSVASSFNKATTGQQTNAPTIASTSDTNQDSTVAAAQTSQTTVINNPFDNHLQTANTNNTKVSHFNKGHQGPAVANHSTEADGHQAINALNQQQQALQQTLAAINTSSAFIDTFMQAAPPSPMGSTASKSQQTNQPNQLPQPTPDQATTVDSQTSPLTTKKENKTDNKQNTLTSQNTVNNSQILSTKHSAKHSAKHSTKHSAKNSAKQNSTNDRQPMVVNDPDPISTATPNTTHLNKYIRQHVFLKLPLQSPINALQIEINIPNFNKQKLHLDAVKLQLHQQVERPSDTQEIDLAHGDIITTQFQSSSTSNTTHKQPRQWLAVTVSKINDQHQSFSGWVYGWIAAGYLYLPLHENTIINHTTHDYWFERGDTPLQAFELKKQPSN